MNLELDKLRCDKKELLQLIRALTQFKQNTIEITSRFHTLTIRAQGTYYRLRAATLDDIRISIPYLGPEYVWYVEPQNLIEDIQKKGALVDLRTKGQPLGWQDDYRSFKKREGISMHPQEMLDNLSFLLRLDQSECQTLYQGIVFNNNEMLSTDKISIHMSTLSTPLSTLPSLCGRGAALVMQGLLSSKIDWTLEGLFGPPNTKNRHDYGTLFFRLREESGIEVEIVSVPRTQTQSLKHRADGEWIRTPIDANAVFCSVASSFLQEICTYSIKNLNEPILVLSLEGDIMKWSAREDGQSDRTEGEIPLLWGAGNQYALQIVLAPERILSVLKKTRDDYTQFIIPCHPLDGFEFYQLQPVYLNTNAQHSALISQMTLESQRKQLGVLQEQQLRKQQERRDQAT